MKISPIIIALNQYPERFQHILVHTGQHYDEKMSKSFFEDLGMPKPDIDLEIGSGTHAEQTGRVMIEFEKVCIKEKPDMVIVVGDVNSTMACTITAKKLGIKVAHVEAGLRSRDMTMPEEINRLCTDVLCDYLFTTDHFANKNLLEEGIPSEKIHFVGNVMIDTLLRHKTMAESLPLTSNLKLNNRDYATLTLHRPSNVDSPEILENILKALNQVAQSIPVIFPIHPRTRKMITQFGLTDYLNTGDEIKGIWTIEPLGYLEFLHLNMHAQFVLTDSGGLQEETTVLGIPCITMRNNTERPITCEIGTNHLVGNAPTAILDAVTKIMSLNSSTGRTIPEKWDGKAAQRIVNTLIESFN